LKYSSYYIEGLLCVLELFADHTIWESPKNLRYTSWSIKNLRRPKTTKFKRSAYGFSTFWLRIIPSVIVLKIIWWWLKPKNVTGSAFLIWLIWKQRLTIARKGLAIISIISDKIYLKRWVILLWFRWWYLQVSMRYSQWQLQGLWAGVSVIYGKWTDEGDSKSESVREYHQIYQYNWLRPQEDLWNSPQTIILYA